MQTDILGGVVGDPVHLPETEQQLPEDDQFRIAVAQAFVVDGLAHITRIDRNPAITWRVEFGATMLHDAQVAGRAEPRKQPRSCRPAARIPGVRECRSIDTGRRRAGRCRHSCRSTGHCRAWPRHRLLPMPLCDGSNDGVFHHPVVDRLALRDRILDAANRALGGAAHESIGRDQIARLQAATKHFAAFGGAAAAGDVEMTILLGHLTDELQLRCRAAPLSSRRRTPPSRPPDHGRCRHCRNCLARNDPANVARKCPCTAPAASHIRSLPLTWLSVISEVMS
jgi:hypothetical protein